MLYFLSSILIGVATYIILTKTDLKFIYKIILILLLVIFVDILLRITFLEKEYVSASEDILVINLFLYINIIISSILIFKYLPYKGFKNIIFRFSSIIILWIIYLNFFSIGKFINSPNENLEGSKKSGNFISPLNFSINKTTINNQTIEFKQGWTEYETKTNYLGFYKKTEPTKKINWVIKLDGNFEESNYNFDVYYKIHDSNYVGATPINKTIIFTTDNKTKEESIFIFKDGDWENFQKIIIKRK